MDCSLCGKKAIADLRYTGRRYCRTHFVEYYEKRVRNTIRGSGMLLLNDVVGVGVSGGKDSLVLLYLLKKFGYNVIAITVDEGIRGYRGKSMPFIERFVTENNIPWYIASIKDEFGMSMDEIMKKKNAKGLACSYCGVLRRNLLNKSARLLGCDKLAIGHNLDDEAQMILMNLMRGELTRLSRAGPIVGSVKDNWFVPRIKPLRECSEKENITYALLNGIKYEDIECPYRHDAMRGTVRNCLNVMENNHPGTKIGILHSFDKMLPFLREYFGGAGKPNRCEECGELASGKVCKACEMLNKINE